MKNYSSAPLPFQGQKRTFLNPFRTALKEFPENATYVDLFGGSGLLGRTVKDFYPNATVIYNDYSIRLAAIPQTNELLASLRTLLATIPSKYRVPSFDKDKVLKIIEQHYTKYGYVDFVTLSSSLLFSGKYVTTMDELKKETFYNRLRKTDISKANHYLSDLIVRKSDYIDLYKEFEAIDNVVYLVDPPYLSTDTKSYKSNGYWKLKDYLNVLDVLAADKYFYFTSSKSQLVELCEWFGVKFGANLFN